jgi:hypothetical protein
MERTRRRQRGQRAAGYAGATEETETETKKKEKAKTPWMTIFLTAMVTGAGVYFATRGLDGMRKQREEEENPQAGLEAAHALLMNPALAAAPAAPVPSEPATKVIIMSDAQLRDFLGSGALH